MAETHKPAATAPHKPSPAKAHKLEVPKGPEAGAAVPTEVAATVELPAVPAVSVPPPLAHHRVPHPPQPGENDPASVACEGMAVREDLGMDGKVWFSLLHNPGEYVVAETPYGSFPLPPGNTLVPSLSADILVGPGDSNSGTMSRRGICRIYRAGHPKAGLNAALIEQASGAMPTARFDPKRMAATFAK